MDSKLIYSVVNSIKYKIRWENIPDNEWLYIGEEGKFNEELIYQKIEELFGNGDLLLVSGRDSSRRIKQIYLQVEIIEKIGQIDFLLCDEKFGKFIEFNKIGIIRIGKIK